MYIWATALKQRFPHVILTAEYDVSRINDTVSILAAIRRPHQLIQQWAERETRFTLSIISIGLDTHSADRITFSLRRKRDENVGCPPF